MKIKDGYILRSAAGCYWVVDVNQKTIGFKKPLMINECAAFIWKCIEQGMREEKIAESLVNKYEVGKEEALEDVNSFICDIKARGFIL